MSVNRSHEGEAELGDDFGMTCPNMDMGGFPDLGECGDVDVEGDSTLQVPKPEV